MAIYVRAIDQMTNHTAGDLRGDMADLLETEGVIDLAGDHLLVEENGTPDMSVDVNPGVAYVLNDDWTEFSSEQRFWDTLVDAITNVAISSNPSGSTRIDLVCLEVDTGIVPNADASNVASITVVEGTPGAGAPALPDNHLQLATVTVVSGATSIDNGDIVDDRTQLILKEVMLGDVSPTITSITSSATPTPTGDGRVNDLFITALAAAAAFQEPSGTPVNGNRLLIRVKDNATPRALTWNAIYSGIVDTLPSTTVTSKVLYMGFIYNSTSVKWELVAVSQEA